MTSIRESQLSFLIGQMRGFLANAIGQIDNGLKHAEFIAELKDLDKSINNLFYAKPEPDFYLAKCVEPKND